MKFVDTRQLPIHPIGRLVAITDLKPAGRETSTATIVAIGTSVTAIAIAAIGSRVVLSGVVDPKFGYEFFAAESGLPGIVLVHEERILAVLPDQPPPPPPSPQSETGP